MSTKYLHHRCESDVKTLLVNHRKCSTAHKPSFLLGWQLHHLANSDSLAVDNRQYRMCHNIGWKYRQMTPPPSATSSRRWQQSTSSGNTTTASEDESRRSSKVVLDRERKLKRVHLVIDGYPPDVIDLTEDGENSEGYNDIEGDIEGESNNTFNNSTKRRKKRCDVLLDSILLSKRKYRKAYNKLK